MPPSSILHAVRAARPAFRQQFLTQQMARQTMRNRFVGRRFQSTTTTTAEAAEAVKVGWFRRMWDSPIGLKTVHFWAPVMKWCIVLAGVADFARPAEKLSLTQNAALTATGAIWTRWCLIIKPRNILLATVNFFLGVVGVVQVTRILMYNAEQKKKGIAAGVKDDVVEDVKQAKDAIKA